VTSDILQVHFDQEFAAPVCGLAGKMIELTALQFCWRLVNASAKSDARFREYVKAGTALCARSI
jgi:hypothetical protein